MKVYLKILRHISRHKCFLEYSISRFSPNSEWLRSRPTTHTMSAALVPVGIQAADVITQSF